MSTENSNQESKSNELYTVLPLVLNVFLVDTLNRLITVVTKNETLNDSQKKFIEKEYGKINFIENGSAGFTRTVVHI
jgi:hypothetical protein